MLTGESLRYRNSTRHIGDRRQPQQDEVLRIRGGQGGGGNGSSAIIRLGESAQGLKAPIRRLADKIAMVHVSVPSRLRYCGPGCYRATLRGAAMAFSLVSIMAYSLRLGHFKG
jgi:cation transport ATPase